MDPQPDRYGVPDLRRKRLAAGCLAALLLTAATALAGETNVYRCTDENGSIELSQFPCPADSDETALTVKDQAIGWKPPASGAEGQAKEADNTGGGKRGKGTREDSAQARRQDQCWNKRRLLDEVNWKLRRGYKAGKGVALRRKRRAYEEYIDRYCD